MNKLLEALKEASISVACLLDDLDVKTLEVDVLERDLQHIQNQITIIEMYLDPWMMNTASNNEVKAWKLKHEEQLKGVIK